MIKNLETLVTPLLAKNCTFVEGKAAKLTAAGDNYGSLILALDVTVEDEAKQLEKMFLVAKMLPRNQFMQKMFNSLCTFPNEVGFYQTIVPCLRQFQKRQGMTDLICSFPEFCSARTSLDPDSSVPDENAVLLIKNIKVEGYVTLDRTVGFDVDQAKLILKKMAEMHATVIALRELQPESFAQNVAPFLKPFNVFELDEEAYNDMISGAINVMKEDEICVRHSAKIREIMHVGAVNGVKKNCSELQNGPFLTLVHTDIWTNNVMVKIVDGRTVDVKFVDFQSYEYGSLTRDVIFFLFSSVGVQILKKHLDDFLNYYYINFVKYLKELHCDTTIFSFEAFIIDLRIMIKDFELFHILAMLAPIHTTKADAKEVEEMGVESMTQHENEVTQARKEISCYLVHEFLRRGWLE